MIRFKDFNIVMTKEPSWLNAPEFEPLDESLIRMNAWIEENEVIVLNMKRYSFQMCMMELESEQAPKGHSKKRVLTLRIGGIKFSVFGFKRSLTHNCHFMQVHLPFFINLSE